MSQRQIFAAALLAGAVLAAAVEFWPRPAVPAPSDGGISLRGKFIGSDAASDAAAFAGVCASVADALELDGKATAPRISTGLQLEDLRTAASEFRFSPVPLRDRQPHAKAAIGKYLDEVVGKSGGPLSETSRTAWVEAFRELARAAEEAVR
jgi:hypothetical protein